MNNLTLVKTGNLAQNTDIGDLANAYVNQTIFATFRGGKSAQTVRAYDAALRQLFEYITILCGEAGCDAAQFENLSTEPEAWAGMTHGIIQTFLTWLTATGYSISTVNVRLSAIKTYAEQAHRAGSLSTSELQKIKAIEKLNQHSDAERRENGQNTRNGAKKAKANTLTLEQAIALKKSLDVDTPQALRDRLLVCLMLDHGLRVSEVAGLTVDQIDLESKSIVDVYRPKVDKKQSLTMTLDTFVTVRAYLRSTEAFTEDRRLIHRSLRSKQLTSKSMSVRTIRYRIRKLGLAIGIDNLSPHDLRHTAATLHYAQYKDIVKLRDFGGWISLAMPNWYAERKERVPGLAIE